MNIDVKLLGIVGCPISHTLSPKIHNFMIDKLGLNYLYLPFKIEKDRLEDFFKAAELLNIRGFNVTIPHKESAYNFVDTVFGDALESKSVNTVKYDGEKFLGYSTDGLGFLLSLKEREIIVNNKNILIIGAGGAARALVISLQKENPKSINIINRDKERAKNILSDINNSNYFDFYDENLVKLTEECDIIINTTPLGMLNFNSDFENFDFLKCKKKIVCDLVYNPLETSFLRSAKENGHFTVSGLDMLIYQAILALEIFTDSEFDKYKLKNDIAKFLIKEW